VLFGDIFSLYGCRDNAIRNSSFTLPGRVGETSTLEEGQHRLVRLMLAIMIFNPRQHEHVPASAKMVSDFFSYGAVTARLDSCFVTSNNMEHYNRLAVAIHRNVSSFNPGLK